jgi:hypothetical protein
MKNIILTIFLLIAPNLIAQKSVSFTVIDSVSKQVVPFLKIIVVGKDKGTYSDEIGFVKINDLSNNDTLYIVDIFYEHKFLQVKALQKNQQIILSPKVFIFNEAIVKPNNIREKEIGYAKIRSNTNFFNAIIGNEMAFLIESKKFKIAFIKEIIIKIKNTKNNPMVKIHLYLNDHGKPGLEIQLKENLITISDKNLLKYNIQNQNIQLPENGIFVSVEWIGKFNQRGVIYNDDSHILNPRINIRSTANSKIKGKGYLRNYGNWQPLLIKSEGEEEFYIPLYGLIIEEQQ